MGYRGTDVIDLTVIWDLWGVTSKGESYEKQYFYTQ